MSALRIVTPRIPERSVCENRGVAVSSRFEELVTQARSGGDAFGEVPQAACLAAAREHAAEQRAGICTRHESGESGSNVIRAVTDTTDALVRGVAEFALYHTKKGRGLLSRVSICALGGYGRAEMNPNSDLDVCLLYSRRLDANIKEFNSYFVPFVWDLGFKAGYVTHSVSEAFRLSKQDPEVYTTYAQARLILGDKRPLAKLRLRLADLQPRDLEALLVPIRRRECPEDLPEQHGDLYAPEPDVKENVGGLRDYHAALWMILLRHGPVSLDDLARLGHLDPDDFLALTEGLDFLWRVRNELHFSTGKAENQLTFAMQEKVAQAFGYGEHGQEAIDRFMQDYYVAARRVRRFLHFAARLCDEHQMELNFNDRGSPNRSKLTVYRGQLCAATDDGKWFEERPSRLMELFWQCARRQVPLSFATRRWVHDNLHLITYAFRSSDVVRRYFTAICSRPAQAGFALRQAAETGLLGAYIPEFAAVKGIVRYEDFHSYPVDEHTLRAVEALAAVPKMTGRIAGVLQRAFENIRNPHFLVLATLLHDLGKAGGEAHVDEGVRIARTVCARMGMPEEDSERVEFLVKHHMLMTNIAFYRDTNDINIVNSFAETMKTDERLRELLLITYADLSAVGPAVWNDWKGALLLKLYLKAERILLGGGDVADEEEYWKLPKAGEVADAAAEPLRPAVEPHLRALGERYLVSYSPKHIVRHMECLEEARETGLAIREEVHELSGMSEVIVCTRDQQGLFQKITGSLTAQLIDVQGADLFTGNDGYVVDCFVVKSAVSGRPLTKAQFKPLAKLLRAVLLDGEDIQEHVDQSRRRLFALLQPRVPTQTRIQFDNDSSTTHTVVDIDTGDRTGLLYDIAQALVSGGVDIVSARIMTDARRVRDAFYVRLDGMKLEDKEIQSTVKAGLIEAIQPILAADGQGEVS